MNTFEDVYNYIQFIETRLSELEGSTIIEPFKNNYKKRDAVEESVTNDNVKNNLTDIKINTLVFLGMCLTVLNILSLVGIYYL